MTSIRYSGKHHKLRIVALVMMFALLTALTGTSCSGEFKGDYSQELIGKWTLEGEEDTYYVFLEEGDLVLPDSDLPSGTYEMLDDGLVAVYDYTDDDEEKELYKMIQDGSDWYLEPKDSSDESRFRRETTDVSHWTEAIEKLDHGDRLDNTTWYHEFEDGGSSYLIHDDMGGIQLDSTDSDGTFSTGSYEAYYGAEAVAFLDDTGETVIRYDTFEYYGKGTFFAEEVNYSDGECIIYYGYMYDDSMEVSTAGAEIYPMYFEKLEP